MLKNLSNINEIDESHKREGYTMTQKFNKEIIKKDNLKSENKMIDPKYIFDKKPKGYKNINSSKYRAPENSNKLPTIKENGY